MSQRNVSPEATTPPQATVQVQGSGTEEILLSESNLERVWMDEGWNVRIEWTEAGRALLAAREAAGVRAEAATAAARRRGHWGAGLIGVAVGASSFAALSRVL